MLKVDVKKNYISKYQSFGFSFSGSFETNKIHIIHGSSGAGKTTLLRLISGLEIPDSGSVTYNDIVWSEKDSFVDIKDRNIGFVFQDYALFPNMSVEEQLAFAMNKKDEQLLERIVRTFDIRNILEQRPIQLSGGQKQRVALARAIVRKPNLLLLDEPLSALDEVKRKELRKLIVEIKNEFQMTVLLVTHYLSEMKEIADHIVEIKYPD